MKDAFRNAGYSFYGHWLVERRARAIADPVARLRYLRSSMGSLFPDGQVARRRRPERYAKTLALVLTMILPLPTVSNAVLHRSPIELLPAPPDLAKERPAPSVWLVEENGSVEVYSNGLRVENRFVVANGRREYPVYHRDTLELVEWRTGPVGIIFHTTESQQAPFNPSHNQRLRNVGKWTLEFIQKRRAYHFVIDRFGRVHRVVRETDSANHAGYSIWADRRFVYVNLNPSFLGISFETETKESAAGAAINPAQIHAATILTEMLRSKYGIRAENCVAHAQVSVFSRSMLVGNHTDWAAGFPFAGIGLGDNYSQPLAAVAIFGFDYGTEYLKATGAELWKGLAFADEMLRQDAVRRGVSVAKYKSERRRRYKEILKVIERTISSEESES